MSARQLKYLWAVGCISFLVSCGTEEKVMPQAAPQASCVNRCFSLHPSSPKPSKTSTDSKDSRDTTKGARPSNGVETVNVPLNNCLRTCETTNPR